MVPRVLFVTGTDTGVGKTVIAAALVRLLCSSGLRAAGFKPIETGVAPGAPSDASTLAEATTVPCGSLNSVYSFADPLAPAVAADRAATTIDIDRIRERIAEISASYDALVVEGAGGVFVPIRWDYTMLDLAADLRAPAVIVARAGLGTINHCLLTLQALRGRGVEIRAIVLNRLSTAPGLAEQTNADAIRRLSGLERVWVVPDLLAPDPLALADAVAPWLRGLL